MVALDGEVDATFGFVDLAGFTALTEAHGDQEAVALLGRFVHIATDAVGSGGRLVKTIGDAVLVTFPAPLSAVDAMRRLFLALAASDLPIARAGLHHGPAVEHDGDYLGATVNLAARVAGHAQGGQVLATSAVADAARRSGISVVELGSFDLRNILQPVELFHLLVSPESAGETIDPVCRMQVARAEAAGRLRHRDRDYWFCSLRCVSAFAADPDRVVHQLD